MCMRYIISLTLMLTDLFLETLDKSLFTFILPITISLLLLQQQGEDKIFIAQ